MNNIRRQDNFNNLERAAKTAAIASIFSMSQDRRQPSGTISGTSMRIRENVAVHHQQFTIELTPQSGSQRRSLRIEDTTSSQTPTRVQSPYVSALRAQARADSTNRYTPSPLDQNELVLDDPDEQQEAEASDDIWSAYINSHDHRRGQSTDDRLLSDLQEVHAKLGQDLRRDNDVDDESQILFDDYDDAEEEGHKEQSQENATGLNQSRLEESIDGIYAQLQLINQRQDRTEETTNKLAERQDRLESATQQSLEATRDLINEMRREAAENTERATNRIAEEIAKAIRQHRH
jgi:hypothetical protein